jgi:diadenosine tetraphosphatase ApaH/serine/threonine PP2A family protein phosphatase
VLLALLTDIHANREALDACLAHAARMKPDRYVFLGDHVGYGADPGYAADVVTDFVAHGAIALKGNHDEAVVGSTAGMNETAREAILWTRTQVDERQRQFLAGLPLSHEEGDNLFVHASAFAPDRWGYVTDEFEAAKSFAATRCRCTFCGHLHVPAVYHVALTGWCGAFTPVPGAAIPLLQQRRWLAVLGAVGQPRDRNPDACYALLDSRNDQLTYYRVPYDVEGAARKVREAGLPISLSARLHAGR